MSATKRQAQVARLYDLKATATDIAEKLGIGSRNTVYQHAYNARRRGEPVPLLPRGAPKRKVDYFDYVKAFRENPNVTEVAAQFGVQPSTVSRALKIMREAGVIVPAPQIGGRRTRKAQA